MQTINYIEKKIISKARSGENKWQDIADLIIEVEKNELWRAKPNTRSFTVWLKSLALESKLSEATLWRAYRAGKKMIEIWNKKQPNNTDSFAELSKKIGDLSAGALDTLETIKKTKVDPSFYQAIESEYLEKKLNVTRLSKMSKDLGNARRLGLKPIELHASLHRIDFSEVVGQKKGVQHLVSDLPQSMGIDALVILPNVDEEVPTLIGILTRDYARKILTNIDYCIAVTMKGVDRPTLGGLSCIEIDCISGQYEIIVKAAKISSDPIKKGRLALTLLNRVLTNHRSILEV